MKEKITERDGEKVVQVRSDAGKLLFVKTKKGYELKCPRSKKVCLVRYKDMLSDCLKCVDEGGAQDEVKELLEKLIKQ